jgi:hypothetical protein
LCDIDGQTSAQNYIGIDSKVRNSEKAVELEPASVRDSDLQMSDI